MCSATLGATPVCAWTCAASSSFSYALRGTPGWAKTLKRVPEFPNAHDGNSIRCCRNASLTMAGSVIVPTCFLSYHPAWQVEDRVTWLDGRGAARSGGRTPGTWLRSRTDRCWTCRTPAAGRAGSHRPRRSDRKSTRLNSSHVEISYAVFCLKKKKKNKTTLSLSPTQKHTHI